MSARSDEGPAEGDADGGRTVGGPMDGAPEGGIPYVCSAAEVREGERRGLQYACDEAGGEVRDLWHWLSDIDESGSGRGFEASEESKLFARMVDQIATVCQLLTVAAEQHLIGDEAPAWIILEQARQQLGHATVTAAEMDGTLPRDDEQALAASLLWLIRRDLLPSPEYAQQRIDFGDGAAEPPDPRPASVLSLVPLQLMANAAMRFGTVVAGPMPAGRVERMAFGTYFASVLDEAMFLLKARARQRGATGLLDGVRRTIDGALVLWGLTPEPWEVFPPVGGESGAI